MLVSTQNDAMVDRFGQIKGNDYLIDAGYTAIDMSLFGTLGDYIYKDDYKEVIKDIRGRVEARGVVFNQSHAPFGGGYDNYVNNLIPKLPRAIEASGLLGIKQIVIHPIQRGVFAGHEKEIFDLNVDFYKSLAPLAKEHGVKIAIENMWQRHPVNKQIVDDICADPHQLAAMYDVLDDPEAFTVCLDIGHVALCRREPADAVRILGHDRLGALHVHDVDYVDDLHTLPGVEKINWDSVCRALGEIDYKGEFTLEADNFIKKYEDEFKPEAAKFMANTAHYLAKKIEAYRTR